MADRAAGQGTQHHPEIVFYDPDGALHSCLQNCVWPFALTLTFVANSCPDPFCVATAPAPKPSAPELPPAVNHTLPLQIWAGGLSGGGLAVVLVNTGANGANINATWRQLGLPTDAAMAVRDVYAGADRGIARGSVGAFVGSHDVAALTLTLPPHTRAPLRQRLPAVAE